MELFDTHAHLCDERFSADLDEVLDRAEKAGVTRILLASADMSDSEAAIRMAAEKTGDSELFCSVGVLPHSASDFDDKSHERLSDWISDRKKTVSLRWARSDSIIIDYLPETFRKPFYSSVGTRLPENIGDHYEREASADVLTILGDFSKRGLLPEMPGVFHCYSGSAQTAQMLVRMGFMLGFDGPVTFRNNKKVWEVLSSVPLDRILIETDSPYLTPEPFRGKRNEPAYIPYILAKITDYLGKTTDEMAQITTRNACRLFHV